MVATANALIKKDFLFMDCRVAVFPQ